MPIHVVRLGEPRTRGEGVRLGTVRRPPRGVPKREYATRDYYDVWLPELSPSAQLLSWAHANLSTEAGWRKFVQRYRAEMREPASRHLIETLAALSRTSSFAIGCYCEDDSRCHRNVLRQLLAEAGAEIV